jgi:hypothetical protein
LRLLPQDFGKPQTVEIDINTGVNNVDIIQLELQFNPVMLGQVSIQPATQSAIWSKNYSVLYSRVDQTTGRISLFLNTKTLHGNGTIATVSFISHSASASSKINFLDKTMVAEQESTGSVLENATPLTILFQ